MSPVRPIRQDTRSVQVTIFSPRTGNAIIKGVWDTKTGGQLDSEERLYHPGGAEDAISLGGRQNPENLVVSRLCRVDRDWDAIPALMAVAGKAKATVVDMPLDFDGNVIDGVHKLTYNGTLKRVQPPEANSESSDPAMIELEITVETIS